MGVKRLPQRPGRRGDKILLKGASFKPLVAAMRAAAVRHNAISQNVANLNTPGYKSADVDFAGAVRKAIGAEDIVKLVTTDARHLTGRSPETEPAVVLRNSTGISSSLRIDGNNVDLEREMVNLAENGLTYQFVVQQLNNRLGMLRYATSEGRR